MIVENKLPLTGERIIVGVHQPGGAPQSHGERARATENGNRNGTSQRTVVQIRQSIARALNRSLSVSGLPGVPMRIDDRAGNNSLLAARDSAAAQKEQDEIESALQITAATNTLSPVVPSK